MKRERENSFITNQNNACEPTFNIYVHISKFKLLFCSGNFLNNLFDFASPSSLLFFKNKRNIEKSLYSKLIQSNF